jgi:hypothetical protein
MLITRVVMAEAQENQEPISELMVKHFVFQVPTAAPAETFRPLMKFKRFVTIHESNDPSSDGQGNGQRSRGKLESGYALAQT